MQILPDGYSRPLPLPAAWSNLGGQRYPAIIQTPNRVHCGTCRLVQLPSTRQASRLGALMLELSDAIDELYLALADARRPASLEDLDICPCCVSDSEAQPLLRTPLRDLTADQLQPYFFTATSEITGPDFLYFLPRILELAFLEDWAVDPERVFVRLSRLEPQSWAPGQQARLTTFMAGLVTELANQAEDPTGEHSYDPYIDEAICCQALSGLDMKPVLDAILEYPALLAGFCAKNPGIETTGWLSNHFSRDLTSPETRVAIVAWLQTDRVLAVLTEPNA